MFLDEATQYPILDIAKGARKALVACRSEFVTTDAAGGVGVFPLDRLRVSGVGVDVAAEFAS